MNTDFDHIKNKFDSDGIRAPESLSEDRILELLEARENRSFGEQRNPGGSGDSGSTRERKRVRPRLSRYIAVAACALLVLTGGPMLYNLANTAPTATNEEGFITFTNYNELDRMLRKIDKEQRSSYDTGLRLFKGSGEMVEEATEDIAYEESATADGAAPAAENGSMAKSSATTGADHSETYLQVEEVDEADIVKTDGKYIYYVTNKQEVVILAAENGKTTRMSTIGSNGVENYVRDIYLKGDILVTTGSVYDNDADEEYTAVVTYDISDRKNPEVLSEYRQSGNIVSSRMVGNFVYLVTSDYVYGDRLYPKCTAEGKYENIPVSDICCVPEPNSKSYVILGAMDITSGKAAKSRTKAVLGASDNIYCNDHNLYATSWSWDDKNQSCTTIAKASISGLDIKFNAVGKVRGSIIGQFAMDEHDDHFRIATTSTRSGMDVNNLYILDSKLKETGKVTGFARNESIKSVRFIGDKAYVITYQAIDPLFVIDVSDPAAPRIEGEVKIDGFSSLLIPVSGDRLLGIGYATGDNGYGGEYASGLKLALFDISDPSEPKVADSKEFENMSSPAQYEHKALVVNSKDGWYAFPYEIYRYIDSAVEESEAAEDSAEGSADTSEATETTDMTEEGVLVFGAKDKINVLDQHKLDSNYLCRSVYIGNYIYSLDDQGNVTSFEFRK